MDTTQLLALVETLPELKLYFRGVFASDTLPVHVRQFPSAMICNTDPIHKKGTHLVDYWFDNDNECEFFDSFGRKPEEYDIHLKEFIDRNALLCLYNKYSQTLTLVVDFTFCFICIAEPKEFPRPMSFV